LSRARILIRGSVLSSMSVFVSMAGLLLVAKMITNELPPAGVGLYMLLLVSADLLNITASFGLASAMPKLVAAAPEADRARLLRGVISGHVLVLTLITILFYLLLSLIPAAVLDPDSDWALLHAHAWLLPPLFVAGALRDVLLAALAGLNRYAHRVAGIALSSTIQVLLVYWTIWRGDGGVPALVGATVSANAAAIAWLYLALPFGRRPGLDLRVYRGGVGFSWPLHANSLLTFVYQRVDTLLVAALLGLAWAAIFEMAKKLPAVLSRLLGAGLVPFLPNIAALLAQGDRATAGHLLHRALVLSTFGGYSATLAILVVQERVILFLFSPDYLRALPVLVWVLVAACLAVQAGIMGQTLIALGRPLQVTTVNLAIAGLSLGLNLALLPLLGIRGAGIAAVTGIACGAAVQMSLVWRQGLPLALRPYLIAQLALVAALALSWLGGDTLPWRVAALLGFVVLCLGAGVVTRADLRQVAGALLPPGIRRQAP